LYLEVLSHLFAAAVAVAVVAIVQATDWVLLPSTYIVIRVDGKGFTK
jgi:tRNA(His) 5'-end guanylyltransferase